MTTQLEKCQRLAALHRGADPLVVRLIATGAAGCSIEDFSPEEKVLCGIDQAAERVQAAAQAIADSGLPFQATARAENLLRGVAALAEHGAQRFSPGGALTRVSLKPVLEAAREMREQGTFSFLAGAADGAEIQQLLS